MEKRYFRQIHLDFHTSPYIPDVGSEFDAELFVSTLKKAHVQSVNLFAKCHHGYCYYPSRIFPVHPSLRRDLLGEMLRVCEREKIHTVIYLPTGWEECSAEKADFLQIPLRSGLPGGKMPFDAGYYCWRRLCHNNAEYVARIKEQIREIYRLYGAREFWLDIVTQELCVCRHCIRSMQKMGLDPQREQDVRRHDHLVVVCFMREIKEFARSLDADMRIFFNMGWEIDDGADAEFAFLQKMHWQDRLEIESIPSDYWGYDHFPMIVNYLNYRIEKPLIGMNGKFHKSWGDFGSLKNREALEYECFRMVANGADCCVGDQLHPRGVPDRAVYERIGEVFRAIEDREAWLKDTVKVSDIAIMIAKPFGEGDTLSEEGAMRMLMELHLPFDIIDKTADLAKYSLLILPDSVRQSPGFEKKLQKYLAGGGKLIATGASCLQNGSFPAEFGLEYVGENEYCPSYVLFGSAFGQIADMQYPYVFYERGQLVRAAGAQTLAQIGKPYFNRGYRKFCSHCQTPFSAAADYPAITQNGNVVYIAYPVFRDYILNGVRLFRDIIDRCLDLLEIPRLFAGNLPTTAEICLRRQGGSEVLHLLHYIPQKKCRALDIVDEKIPLYHTQCQVRCGQRPGRVMIVPQMQELPFRYERGCVHFEIPYWCGYCTVLIEKEG